MSFYLIKSKLKFHNPGDAFLNKNNIESVIINSLKSYDKEFFVLTKMEFIYEEEKARLISNLWVFSNKLGDKHWIYANQSLLKLIYIVITEWRADKHLKD